MGKASRYLPVWLCILFLCVARPAAARDAQAVGDWLCRHIFEAPGIVLAMACDGFFGLSLMPENGPPQDITGLWHLAPDGVQLTLFNRQDRQIKLAVGASAIHGTFLNCGPAALEPAQNQQASFRLTGLLEKTGPSAQITDAASGYAFAAPWPENARDGSFATAELTISGGLARETKILKHSAPVPRFFAKPPQRGDAAAFGARVAGRYWLLPSMPGIEKGALRFGAPARSEDGQLTGIFDVTGPGLRLEGAYTLNQDKLTLKAGNASIRNLKLMGAEALADSLLGVFSWRLLPRGLELSGARRLLLLENQS